MKLLTLKSALEMKDLAYVEKRSGVFGYYLILFNEKGWIIGYTKDYEEKRINNFIKNHNLKEF